MFNNYLKIAFRNLLKNKIFSIINIFGLAVGLCCSILIFLWVQDELEFNQFHTNSDQIFKIMQNRENENGSIMTWGFTSYPLGEVLKNDYSAISDVIQYTGAEEFLLKIGDQAYKEQAITASPNFFQVFSFHFIAGDTATALTEQPSIVISESLSKKFFGGKNPLGQTIQIDVGELYPFTVTGVFEDIPYHSTLQFDLVVPLENVLPFNNYTSWGSTFLTTYLKLNKNADPSVLNQQIAGLIRQNSEFDHELFLLSLTDTYRYTKFENGKPVGGRIDNIRLFTIIAILVLLIACINFINLTTARSTLRAREVGVRKVAGASKFALIRQFLGESALTVLIAMVIAVALVILFLPAFNLLTEKQITNPVFQPYFLITISLLGFVTSLLSGIYPAFVLSSYQTISALKGKVSRSAGSFPVRSSLVVFQFVLSTIFIVGTLVVYFQMEFIRDKNLGLDQENIIYSEMDINLQHNFEAFRNELQQEPSVKYLSRANSDFKGFGETGDLDWEGKPEDKLIWMPQLVVDFDFIEALGIKMKEGRAFSRNYSADTIAYIINEEAIEVLGFEDPVGQEFSMWRQPGKIVGVAENFNFSSLHEQIKPLIIQLAPQRSYITYLKAEAGQTEQALGALKRVHEKYSSYPLDYHFLNATLEDNYKNEMLVSQLSRLFTGMAILISCMGLLGLAIFTTQLRTKEIGIRKILGASASGIIMLLSRDYIKLMLIAFAVAIPIANYFITEWLNNFAYRIDLQWWYFAITGISILVIALFSISTQTWKAARQNPADSLRDE